MESKSVQLRVPAEASFARTVRMMAANLAVCCDMDVDEVEDLRMAAEEGFVYSCSTKPDECEITFSLGADAVSMEFSLGSASPEPSKDSESLDFVELLLAAVCDDFGVSEDGSVLRLVKSIGSVYGG